MQSGANMIHAPVRLAIISLVVISSPIIVLSARADAIRYVVTNLGRVTTPVGGDIYDGDNPQYRDGRAPHFDALGNVTYSPVVPYGYYVNAPIFHGPKPPGYQWTQPGDPTDNMYATVSAGSYSAGIANSSPIVGSHVFISDGATTRLLSDYTYGGPLGINRLGQMTTGGVHYDALYDFRDGSTKPLYGLIGDSAARGSALGINDLGQVVGRSAYDPVNPFGGMHAWLALTPGAGFPTDLNGLIDPKSRWLLESASGISNDGRIAGVGLDGNGSLSYYLLTPRAVPEPTTLALLVVGAAVLVISHRRRSGRAGSEAC